MTSCEYSPAGTSVFVMWLNWMQQMGVKYQVRPPIHLLNLDIKCTRLRIRGPFRRSENYRWRRCFQVVWISCSQKNHRHDPCNICLSTLLSGKCYRCLRALTLFVCFPEAVQLNSVKLMLTALFMYTVFKLFYFYKKKYMLFYRSSGWQYFVFFILWTKPMKRPKKQSV